MDCNKEEAARAKQLAEDKMRAGDFVGAHRLVMKAQRLFPNLENIPQMIAICDVHSSADKKIMGLDNWYAILQVQQFADTNTIKKQYRKLALLLHPDKNKFAGAEAAFKLVGEANRLLADQLKRSQYDVRYRSHSMVASKQSNVNSSRHCTTTNNGEQNIASVYTFWTCCKHCGYKYKYLRVYMNNVMFCSSCQKSYTARDIGCNGVPPSSSTAGVEQFQDSGMHNTSQQNASTGAESGSSSAEMDKNGPIRGKLKKKNQENQKIGAGDRKSKKYESCTENDAEGGKPLKGETDTNNFADMSKADLLKPQPEVKEQEVSAAKSIPDLSDRNKNQAAKKRRKTVEEPYKSFEVDRSDVVGAKTDANEYNKRKTSWKKPQVFNTERSSDGVFVRPPAKKTKSSCEFDSDSNTKQTVEDDKSHEPADSSGVSPGSSRAYEGKAKKNANSGNEDILSAKNKEREGCDGNEEDAGMSSKIDKVENGYKANRRDIPDPELNVFEVERETNNFAVNQVWSTCDSRDDMPRKYVRVKKVLNGEFKLRITYLEPVWDKNDTNIPVACGKFKNGETKEVEDRSIFSCQVFHSLSNRIVSIYPKKGEIWSIFRDWNEEWNTSVQKHKLPYKYDFVEILTDYNGNVGLGVAYLRKLKGFVSRFHWEAHCGVGNIHFAPHEMLRFSHKVPAVKITGKEKEADSFELDTAALPKDISQVGAVDMEMDSETLKGEIDGPYHEAPNVEVKAMHAQQTASSPRKRRKSEDNGVCSNHGEVKERTSRSHEFSSCQVHKKNTPNASRKNAEAADVFKLRKSPRLQTIPSQQIDEFQASKETASSPRKRRKSEDNGVCSNLGEEVKEGRSHDFSSCVNKKNTPNASSKNGEAADVSKLRKSPRLLQTTPSQQIDEKKRAKQGTKMNTPTKTDKGSLGIKESSNGIHQPVESQEGKGSKRQGRNGELPSLSKQNILPTQLDVSTNASPETSSVSSSCKTLKRNAFDFKNQRSEDKFQVDQIWAIYSNDKEMPREYVKIKKIVTMPEVVLHIKHMDRPSTEPVALTCPVSCGDFKLRTRKPKTLPPTSFSHQVNPVGVNKNIVTVEPRKGEIWALYKNNDRTEEEHDIVQVVEDYCDGKEIAKAVAMTAQGSNSLYIIQREQESNVAFITIPKVEMRNRFSHQIPAIRHHKRTTRRVEGGGYWELDPRAIPVPQSKS